VRRGSVGAPPTVGAWAALGWIGLVFLIVGGTDFVLAWFPTDFGSPEWEFATVTQSFNGLPIVLLGLGLLVIAAEQVDRSWWWWVGVVGLAALIPWVVVGLGIWSLNVGVALATVPEELRVGIQKAVTKTAIQGAVYPVAMGYLLLRAWMGRSSATARVE
jgi:hypothetical protein